MPEIVEAPLPGRLWTYQSERFPIAAYIPLMAVATFAAVAFSRGARSPASPFPWGPWAVAALTVLVVFFFLRVLDEHKDAAQDARSRPELPVPRGLVTLRELQGTALAALAVALLLNTLVEPALLVVLAAVLAWAGFMGREFFVPDWLRARPGWYLVSHMLVMPLIFLYATAADWLVAGADPPAGTAAFLALAFCNGLVIEVGRKLRSPAEERDGVDTYTAEWGPAAAVALWLSALVAAAMLVLLIAGTLAGRPGSGGASLPVLAGVAVLAGAAVVPAVALISGSPRTRASHLELASGFWVLASYGLVGALGWAGGAG